MVDDADERVLVLAALDRLTSWPEMARSPQLTRFLDYIVRRRLDGDAQSIKAYSIAVDVFGRPTDFDPQSDPIVRVQARRLRGLLDQYYRGPGAEETLRIVLPTGRYVPDFLEASAIEMPVAELAPPLELTGSAVDIAAPRGQVTVSWLVLLVIAIGAAALAYSLSTWGPRQQIQSAQAGAMQQPSLRVMEFQNLSDDPSVTAAISGLAVDLVGRLQPLQFLSVDYGGRGEVGVPPVQSDGYVLTGIVRPDPLVPGNFQYNIILTELQTNNIVWNRSLPLTESQLSDPDRIDRLSIDLLAVLGNPRGPLHARARRMLMQRDIRGGENLYLCTLLFSMYRETSTLGAAERARACFEALSEADQQTGTALAAMASLTAETVDSGVTSPSIQLERYAAAGAMLAKAVGAAPTSSFVWEQRARLYEKLGQHDLSEAAYGTALQSNPSNMDAMAAHARHMALSGRLAQAIPLAQRAIDASMIIPDWYYGVPALAALLEGNFAKAGRDAQIYARSDGELGPILTILAAQGAGNADEVARQLPRVLDVASFRSGGIITQLRRRITDAGLLDRIRAGLTQAGIPAMSLVTTY